MGCGSDGLGCCSVGVCIVLCARRVRFDVEVCLLAGMRRDRGKGGALVRDNAATRRGHCCRQQWAAAASWCGISL